MSTYDVLSADGVVYIQMPPDDGSVRLGVNPSPIGGEPCPACGRKVPLSGAERQRRWRERKAERDGV